MFWVVLCVNQADSLLIDGSLELKLPYALLGWGVSDGSLDGVDGGSLANRRGRVKRFGGLTPF